MSKSSRQIERVASAVVPKVSSAIVALRFGRNPYEHGRKSASKTGSITSFAAIWTTRSRTVGMPIVIESTPAAPLLRFTRIHAAWRTSLRQTWSYSAWKRLPGDRLAATHSRRCSRRSLSTGLGRSGWSGPRVAAHRHHYGPLGLRLRGARFALGSYETPCRDCGCADGPPRVPLFSVRVLRPVPRRDLARAPKHAREMLPSPC